MCCLCGRSHVPLLSHPPRADKLWEEGGEEAGRGWVGVRG